MMRTILLLIILLTGVAHAASPQIVVMGDSLSAAYGIGQEQGWVALLQTRLQQNGYPQQVVNASVSGETTAGGLRRLPAILQQTTPQWLLLELGANDGLRVQSLDAMQANLQRMVELAQQAGAQVLLFEMRIPSNYGPRYTAAFQKKFSLVSEAKKIHLLPFFMHNIATNPKMFQDDGIHPTAAAQPVLLDTVWETLQPLLKNSSTP